MSLIHTLVITTDDDNQIIEATANGRQFIFEKYATNKEIEQY